MFSAGHRLNQFILKQLLYTSRLSQIWKVLHVENNRPAVIKIALTWKENGRDTFGETANSLVRNEAQILPHLSHPGIVQIYPLLIDDENMEYSARAAYCAAEIKPWYFAMKWVDGIPLSECFAQVLRQSFEWRMELFYQLLIIIEYMHQNGCAHMDLKPENILIDPISANMPPRLTVIDLGCASSNPHQMTSDPGGTDQYAPIELLIAMHSQLISDSKPTVIPVKVDIWSLGAIFFELVTAEPLFESGMNALTIRDTMLQKSTKRITESKVSFPNPQRLDRYLHLMLQLNARDRAEIGTLIQYLEEQISPPPRM